LGKKNKLLRPHYRGFTLRKGRGNIDGLAIRYHVMNKKKITVDRNRFYGEERDGRYVRTKKNRKGRTKKTKVGSVKQRSSKQHGREIGICDVGILFCQGTRRKGNLIAPKRGKRGRAK